MARKIFYIIDYWRVLKICARIHIEAYGLGGGFVVYDNSDNDCANHLFHFTSEARKKNVSLFQMVRSRMVNNFGPFVLVVWHYAENRATFERFNIQSNYDQCMKFLGETLKKMTKECSWREKKNLANDYTPFGYTKIVWCIRVLLQV